MSEFEEALQKKKRGFSNKELLDDFIQNIDDYDSVFILGKRKEDGDFITSWSFEEDNSVIGAIELAKYTIMENRHE